MKYLLRTLLLALAVQCQATTIEGRVVGVADGDTITVLNASDTQHKIRLAGIDAPEKHQPFGQRSKESLSDLVFGRAVMVETDKRDKYGRNVGKVLVDGNDANLEKVKRGLACHYKQYEKEQPANDRVEYAVAEGAARASRLGLWADAEPVAPWEFRHRTKAALQ